MGKSASRAFVLILLGPSLAGADVRRPRGIYAVVILAEHHGGAALDQSFDYGCSTAHLFHQSLRRPAQ